MAAPPSGLVLAGIGFLGGILGGLLGVGGGFVMVPLLVLWGRLRQRQANGTVLAVILPISVVGALVYYFGGRVPQVDLRLALFLVIGSVFGAFLGARTMNRLPERTLKLMLVVLLVAVGLKELLLG